MKALDIIARSTKNLFRSKMRTFLTIMAIFIGTFTLSLTTAIGEGSKAMVDSQMEKIGADGSLVINVKQEGGGGNPMSNEVAKYSDRNEGQYGTQMMTNEDFEKVADIDGIEKVYKYYSVDSEYVVALDGEKYVFDLTSMPSSITLSMMSGKMLGDNDENKIVITYKYVEALGLNNENDAIGKKITVVYKNYKSEELSREYEVVGVLSNSFINGGASYISLAEAEIVNKFQTDGTAISGMYPAFIASYDPEMMDEEVQGIKKALNDIGLDGQTVDDQVAMIKGVVSTIQIAIGIFSVITVVASTFGVINTLLMSVYERIQEIGLMKALGMSSSGIFALFSFEAMSIGFWGGVLGVLGAYVVGMIGNEVFKAQNFFGLEGINLFVFRPLQSFSIIGALVLVSFIAGVMPAVRAARLDPISALRTE